MPAPLSCEKFLLKGTLAMSLYTTSRLPGTCSTLVRSAYLFLVFIWVSIFLVRKPYPLRSFSTSRTLLFTPHKPFHLYFCLLWILFYPYDFQFPIIFPLFPFSFTFLPFFRPLLLWRFRSALCTLILAKNWRCSLGDSSSKRTSCWGQMPVILRISSIWSGCL